MWSGGMPCDPGLLESYAKDISALLESFSEKDPAGKQALVQLLTSDAHVFSAASIRVLANAEASPGARFLMYLLTKEKLLTAGLRDPDTCSLKDAVAAVRAIGDMGPRFQAALETDLSAALQGRASEESAMHVMRILDLLAAIPTQNFWPSFQSELMAYPDRAVRSKAALLIGRNTTHPAWFKKQMTDGDARVQANAVEALWAMDAAEARPVFTAALKSQNNRVVANAILGLYRLSDLKAVTALLDMARHPDPLFRASAWWAIAETEDPRFIPFLMEQFKSSQGKMKLAVTRTLSRIRRSEKASAEKGTMHVQISSANVEADGERHVEFALSRPDGGEITSIKPTEFALWEGGTLIENYEVKLPNNPAALVIGSVAPRFVDDADLYGRAMVECLKRCLSLKRPDDWWRIDRYAIEAVATDPNAPVDKSSLPYDDALITQELKTRKGFISDAAQLEKAISLPVPRERTTEDALRAIRRQIDAMDKSSGKRHLFVFVHRTSVDALDDPENLKPLRQLIEKEGIILHGVCPESWEKCEGFRDLCLATPDGTFHTSSVDKLADEFEQTYRHLLNRYEIDYSLPVKAEAAQVTLQLCSEYGVGRAEFSLAPQK
jgi:hypothetical protein